MSNKFIKGAMILSLSMFLARILGLIYIIPFQSLVGPAGLALYSYAYVPYNVLLSLATLGLPVGIAKFIAKYNAAGEYDTSRRMFRFGLRFMILLGVSCFIIMYAVAPTFARIVIRGEGMYNTVEDVTMAIRMVSFAVIIVPSMSILRGFFQGNQDMTPTAISQLVEQLIRITIIVLGSFIIIRLLPNGTTQMAVNVSVFAAFVASVGSLIILYRHWLKNKDTFDEQLMHSVPHRKRKIWPLFKELISYALPFALLSLVVTWFQLIDTIMFNASMVRAGVSPTVVEEIFGIYSTSLLKIVMIPVSFAIAFSQPLMPIITEKIQIRDFRGFYQTMKSAITLTTFVTVPAVIGLGMLSNPIFIVLFNQSDAYMNQMGGMIFGYGSILGIFMALNIILNAIMQGIGKQYKALGFLVIGILVKIIGNFALIHFLTVRGAIFATVLAYTVCIILQLLEIRKVTRVKIKWLVKKQMAILVFSLIMAISVWIATIILNQMIDYSDSRLSATIYVAIAGLVGMLVYGFLIIYFDVAKGLFGAKLSYERIKGRILRKK